MPRKFTAKSTTSESRTAPTEVAEEVAVVEAPAEPEAEAKPAPMANGMLESKWGGQPMWHCTKCGHDTFDAKEAKAHACMGRVVKPYKGEKS